jgi:CelD/BcsL family acetyltransferase involved in cellulose biosynthesis
MEFRCLRDEGAFETLEGAWAALHARSVTATPFNSVVYSRLWWRHLGMPGALQVWTAWEDGELLGVAPLYETRDEHGGPALRFVGGLDLSDYLDVVAEPGREAEVVSGLLAAWIDASCCCTLDLHALPHASPTREAFFRLAREGRVALSEQQEEVCPVIPLPASWDAYLEGLPGRQRRELRRKLRKAGQDALVAWYNVERADLEEEIEHFLRLHALSSPEKAHFMNPARRAFFMDLAREFCALGWLDLCFLLVDGVRAAAYFSFLFRDQVLVYNSGFDEQVNEGLSPGWLLLCFHIEWAIAKGHTRYDFLRGDEEYKFRFGAKAEPIYHARLTC